MLAVLHGTPLIPRPIQTLTQEQHASLCPEFREGEARLAEPPEGLPENAPPLSPASRSRSELHSENRYRKKRSRVFSSRGAVVTKTNFFRFLQFAPFKELGERGAGKP